MEGGPPSFPQTHRGSWYSGANPSWRAGIAYGALTPSGGTFQSLRLAAACSVRIGPTTPALPKKGWFGLLPVRSPLLGESRLISCRAVTEMFQFTAGPSRGYAFPTGCLGITPGGLPHSDTQGSSLVCSSPCTFRRSPRPSSAFSAWASSSYSLSLVSAAAGSFCSSAAARLRGELQRAATYKLPLFLYSLNSLSALGKIEVMVILLCIAVGKVQAGTPGNWKVEAAQSWPCPRLHASPSSCSFTRVLPSSWCEEHRPTWDRPSGGRADSLERR